jgi:Flp pilus assembly protein TadG
MYVDGWARKAARGFRIREDGSATVEAVMWLPLFFFLIIFVLDASMMFNAQSRALRIVQDTNRALAVGQLADVEEAKAQLRARMAEIAPSAEVDATITGNLAQTWVAMPLGEISLFNTFAGVESLRVTASSQQLIEN